MFEEPKTIRRRRRWPWLVLLTLAGFVALAFVLVPRPKLLLARAHRVTPIHYEGGTAMVMPHQQNLPYFLLSEKEAVVLRPFPRQNETQSFYIARIDLFTGKSIAMPQRVGSDGEITSDSMFLLYPNGRDIPVYPLPECAFSPDGKWLLCSQGMGYHASTLDGKTQKEWMTSNNRDFFLRPMWLSDNHHWIAHFWNGVDFSHLYVGDVNNPARDYETKIGNLPTSVGVQDRPHYVELATGEIAAAQYDLAMPTDHVDFQAVRLDGKVSPAPVRKFTTTLTSGCSIYDFTVSPQGDRIAWACKMLALPPGPAPIRKFLSLFGARTHSYVGIWTSKIDGSDLREVGHLPEQKNTDNDAEALLITDLRWTPNGKRLGFVYDGSLWTVPVE